MFCRPTHTFCPAIRTFCHPTSTFCPPFQSYFLSSDSYFLTSDAYFWRPIVAFLLSRDQLFKNWIILFTGYVTIQHSQCVPLDAFGEISAQANDSYTFTFVLYKFHMAFKNSLIIHKPINLSNDRYYVTCIDFILIKTSSLLVCGVLSDIKSARDL